MEQLPQLGTAISDVVMPTYRIYTSILQQNASKITSTPCDTFTYGPHPRQQLDIYTPSANTKSVRNRRSVLMFLYGGGLVRGEKSNGLVYANLGHYFSQHLGFPVAVVDYRLVFSHDAKFPSGGEDLKLALDFIVGHFVGTEPIDLFLMGNSAGAVHTSTYLLADDFREHRKTVLPHTSTSVHLKGVILLGAPFDFQDALASRNDVLHAYYGDQASELCPLGLFEKARENGSIEDLSNVNTLIMTSTLDPEDEILRPNRRFVQKWKETPSVAENLTIQSIDGHNHISPVLACSTGIADEETWCRDVVAFVATST